MRLASPPTPAILETAIYGDDLDAMRGFYEGVMELEVVTAKPGRHVFFRLQGAILLVFAAKASAIPPGAGSLPVPPHGSVGPGHVCFAADEAALDLWRQRLIEHGVEIEADFQWPNGARSIYVRDPAGNSVEFAEPRLWFA